MNKTRLISSVIFGLAAAFITGLIYYFEIAGTYNRDRLGESVLAGLTVGVIASLIGIAFLPDWFKSSKEANLKRKTKGRAVYREALSIAEREVDDNKQDPGLWTQALVEAGGDETKRKVKYLTLRAKDLCEKAELKNSQKT